MFTETPIQLQSFYNRHAGQTALLVGNAPNLHKTPPQWFNYPSFGLNTIYKYTQQTGWKPDYWVGVDDCLFLDHGDGIRETYPDIPKFLPSPDRDWWQARNVYRFYHRTGNIVMGGKLANQKDALSIGLGYWNVMHVAMQLAWHMGFKTLLMIGVEQKPDAQKGLTPHFWGDDPNMPIEQTDEFWNKGYSELVHSMTDVRVLNISQDTYVPEEILPRGDWKEWCNNVRENN